MSVTPEFEQTWKNARASNNVATLTALAATLEQADVPQWLARDCFEFCKATALDLAFNRMSEESDSSIGSDLINISFLLDNKVSAPFVLVGLAFECNQPTTRNEPLADSVPGLLWETLEYMGPVTADTPTTFRNWRELAVRRVEALTRPDIARDVNAGRDAYIEHVEMAEAVMVADVASGNLSVIRRRLDFYQQSHFKLCKFLPYIEHPQERKHLLEGLESLSYLIQIGERTLGRRRY